MRRQPNDSANKNGEPVRVRTGDLLIKSQLLYQLSYGPLPKCAEPNRDSAMVNGQDALLFDFYNLYTINCFKLKKQSANRSYSASILLMKTPYFIAFLSFTLVACATNDQRADVRFGTPTQVSPSLKPERMPQKRYTPASDDSAIQKTKEASASLATAATAPLDDLNLRRPIPPRALEDLGYIYQARPRPSCAAIQRELYVLQQALQEPDADDEAIELSKRQKRAKQASKTTLEVVRSTTSSLIPFSGVVRAASGANAAKRHYDKKFDEGRRRRAFLKGYALGIGCRPPASPKVLYGPKPKPDPEYNTPARVKTGRH